MQIAVQVGYYSMINLECSICGNSIVLESGGDYHGDATLIVHCEQCNINHETIYDELSDEIEKLSKENEELRDFIDGYIKDR